MGANVSVIFGMSHPWNCAAGALITAYAAAEVEFNLLLSAVLDISIYEMALLVQPYSASTRRDVFKAIVKLRLPADDPKRDKLLNFLGRHKEADRLRNHLAHSNWVNSDREGAFRPMYAQARDGKAKFFGVDPTEHDFTVEEVQQVVKKLQQLIFDMRQFKKETGYYEVIQENMNRTRYD
ncbi:hypothetical protein [Erythrobacter westpacificensis]